MSESPACSDLALSASSRPLRAVIGRGRANRKVGESCSKSKIEKAQTSRNSSASFSSRCLSHALSRHEEIDGYAALLPLAAIKKQQQRLYERDRSNYKEPGAAATAPKAAVGAAKDVLLLVVDVDIRARPHRSRLPLLRRPRFVMDHD